MYNGSMTQSVTLSTQTKELLKNYLATSPHHRTDLSGGNDKTLSSAVLYEKIRVALEYQEEHLIFKNAIARILRRKYTITPGISAEHLLADLINELSWANYLNPEAIGAEATHKLNSTLVKYLKLLESARSKSLQKLDLEKTIIDLAACEASEILNPTQKPDLLIDYAFEILAPNLRLDGSHISEKESEIQLKLAIYTLLYKPDIALVHYWILQKIYPEWHRLSEAHVQEFGRQFDSRYYKIESTIHHPQRKKYFQFVRRNIPPFILLKNILTDRSLKHETITQNPNLLGRYAAAEYDKSVSDATSKVWRGTIRALIFIFITKISLALILEVPFDHFVRGKIDYLPLIINILLPPALMLLAGVFIKSPSAKNREAVSRAFGNIIILNRVDGRSFYLVEHTKSFLNSLFNFLYFVLTIGIIGGVIWLLLKLDFNVLSIALFFIFISAISFFSFRIRNIALELAMTQARDDLVTSTIEFLFLPFIRMGKFISELFARSNPLILMLDFLIEAPLKTILAITNRWFKFVRSKKEEIEY
jgi:hypothetical protein